MRFTARVTIFLLFTQVLALGLGSYFLYLQTKEALRSHFAEQTNILAETIGYGAQEPFCSRDPSIIKNYLRTLTDNKNLRYVILRKDNVEIASSGKVLQSGDVFAGKQMKEEIEKNRIFTTFASVAACTKEGLPAELEIGVDFAVLDKPLSSVIHSISWTIFAEFLLAGIVFIFLGRAVSKRVFAIEEVCAKISNGDLDARIDLKSNDEFSTIGRAVNGMAVSLYNLLQERDRQRQELTAASKLSSLGEMAGGVAHEINNPLAILRARAEQIRELLAEPDFDRAMVMKFLDSIEVTSSRIAKIVQSLRSISRNAETDPFAPVPVTKIIEETMTFLQEKIKSRGIEILLELGDQPIAVNCRESEIIQVLLNLFNNSIDAITGLKEQWLHVRVTALKDKVEIRIIDSGTGIPNAVIEKIFNPFFTTKGVGKGTGLGLSISKKIIENHGGDLYVDTSFPHTCFVINLQRTDA